MPHATGADNTWQPPTSSQVRTESPTHTASPMEHSFMQPPVLLLLVSPLLVLLVPLVVLPVPVLLVPVCSMPPVPPMPLALLEEASLPPAPPDPSVVPAAQPRLDATSKVASVVRIRRLMGEPSGMRKQKGRRGGIVGYLWIS